jgi:predicted phage terminase large subunit-like protein
MSADIIRSGDKQDVRFLSAREKFNLLPPERRKELITKLDDETAARLNYDWEYNGRPKQLAPDHHKSKATSFCMCAYLEAQMTTNKKLKLEDFKSCDEKRMIFVETSADFELKFWNETGFKTQLDSGRAKIVKFDEPESNFDKTLAQSRPTEEKPELNLKPANYVCKFRSSWQTWVLLAGRGFGKTRVGAELVRENVEQGNAKRIAIISPTAADARDVAIEGESGLLNICPPWQKPIYESTKRRITWPNGAQASMFSAEEPERLRGPQFDFAWIDEIAGYDINTQQMTWDMLNFGLRLGKNPRAVVTTTPKPTPLIQTLVKLAKDPINRVIITTGSTYENRSNLAAPFMRQITQYEGTNLGRQEIYAELIDIEESGILKRSWFKQWPANKKIPLFDFVIQSYDTAFTDKTRNDPTGCVTFGVFKPDPESPHCIMILDAWVDHLKYPELRNKAKEEYLATYGDQKAKVDLLLIEDKGSGISLIQDLQRAGLPIRKYNPGRPDKVMRLHAVSHLVYNGRVYIPESKKVPGEFVTWAEDFIRQVCGFPNTEHDEYVDCFSQALAVFRDQEWVTVDPMPDKDPYEDDERELNSYNNPYDC